MFSLTVAKSVPSTSVAVPLIGKRDIGQSAEQTFSQFDPHMQHGSFNEVRDHGIKFSIQHTLRQKHGVPSRALNY